MSVSFPIHHTFGPLVTREQWKRAFLLQFQPWKWMKGSERENFRGDLSRSFGSSAALFASGREALLASLRALELKSGEEVIIQAFTCIVIPNAVHAAGGVPVFADIDPETLNLDLEKLQGRITTRTRAIICQHTFGIPVDTKRLRAICDKRHLALIEDAAHIIPDSGSGAQLSFLKSAQASGGIGLHSDVLLFSFGRDKAISGVSGGAALTRHPALAERLKKMEDDAPSLSAWLTFHYLSYPLRYHFAKMLWKWNLGKPYLQLMRILHLLPPVLTAEEKEGRAQVILHKMPNALAILVSDQLHELPHFNEHRRKLAKLYGAAAKEGGWQLPLELTSATTLQKFPLFVKNSEAIRTQLKKEEIYLDDGWNSSVITPPSVKADAAGYMQGSCPRAEEVVKYLLLLPLHPTMSEEDAEYLQHALSSLLR
jgi:dTDP-4-amino-4,6-dideoxygalactose transaminase